MPPQKRTRPHPPLWPGACVQASWNGMAIQRSNQHTLADVRALRRRPNVEHNRIINAIFLTESDCCPGALILPLPLKLSFVPSSCLLSLYFHYPSPLPVKPVPHTALLSYGHTAVLPYYHTDVLQYCWVTIRGQVLISSAHNAGCWCCYGNILNTPFSNL